MDHANVSLQKGHKFMGRCGSYLGSKWEGNDDICAIIAQERSSLFGIGQVKRILPFTKDNRRMWVKSEYNSLSSISMSAGRQFANDFLVATMDTIECTNTQPGVLEVNIL
jgi:hypothetical protein